MALKSVGISDPVQKESSREQDQPQPLPCSLPIHGSRILPKDPRTVRVLILGSLSISSKDLVCWKLVLFQVIIKP